MAGLIDSGVDTTPNVANFDGSKVANASSTSFTPAQMAVDPSTQSVSGQLDAILGKGSPLIDRARAGAADYANSRGLINSSIAAGAGEGAAIDRALPIAQQDASMYGHVAEVNTNAQNTALQTGAQAANTASLTNANADNNIGQIKTQGEQARQTLEQSGEQNIQQVQATGGEQRQNLNLQGQIETNLQKLKGTQANDIAGIEANYRQLIQTSQSAGNFYTDWQKNMAVLLSDTNTSAEQKQAMASKMTEMLKTGLSVLGAISNVDLTGLLNFTGA